jgi:hypothetical protein
MKKSVNSLPFYASVVLILLVYFSCVVYLLISYEKVEITNNFYNIDIEKNNTQNLVEFPSGSLFNKDTFKYILYIDLFALTASVLLLISLIYRYFRSRSIVLDKKFLIEEGKKFLKEARLNEYNDNEIRYLFEKKGWKDEDINKVMS